MKKIKLLKVRNIPFVETEEFSEPLPNKDYIFSFTASRKGSYVPDTHGEETEDRVYHMEVIDLVNVQELGSSKKIKYERGHSPSQRQRYAIMDWLKRTGKDDDEENYKKEIDKIIKHYNNKDI